MNNSEFTSIAILGGSFNPVHFGHLRLAVEMHEALFTQVLDFVPTARPPHKRGEPMLPFELRCHMLESSVAPYPFFRVNRLEGRREGVSYTYDTLLAYRACYERAKLYFIVGSEDFELLDSWKNWRLLPDLATLAVAARQGGDTLAFEGAVRRFWPQALRVSEGENPWESAFSIPGGGKVVYLPIPRLDINASLIRKRWNNGRGIDFWVPAAVSNILRENSEAVKKHWSD